MHYGWNKTLHRREKNGGYNSDMQRQNLNTLLSVTDSNNTGNITETLSVSVTEIPLSVLLYVQFISLQHSGHKRQAVHELNVILSYISNHFTTLWLFILLLQAAVDSNVTHGLLSLQHVAIMLHLWFIFLCQRCLIPVRYNSTVFIATQLNSAISVLAGGRGG